jgi:predicted phosphodiesterase
MRLRVGLSALVALAITAAMSVSGEAPFTFVILGDRTGEAQPGVYEQVWKEATAEKPAFILSVGDSIQGTNDETAAKQWQEVAAIWKPYRRVPLYLAAGNHDIWSVASEQLYTKYSGRPTHYSFDYRQVHFTVLDNSRSDEFPPGELEYLEQDLKAHASAAAKVILSHRPSWIVPVALRNPDFKLHKLARQYGVRYVIAGHVHQMLRFELEGVTYISMVSSGGHLRLSKAYNDGWFFGHALVEANGPDLDIRIEEVKAPLGEGRVTKASEWGILGLVRRLLP